MSRRIQNRFRPNGSVSRLLLLDLELTRVTLTSDIKMNAVTTPCPALVLIVAEIFPYQT